MDDTLIAGVFGIIIVLMIYFIPSMVGADKKYQAGIFVINLFLGWTLIGWVAALVWAVSSPLKEDS